MKNMKMIMLVVVFISLSMFKIAFAQNKITIDEDNFYKLAEDKFKNNELYGKFTNTMKKLYETQEGIVLYERFLKIINDVSLGSISDYANNKNAVELLDQFCKVAKNIANKKNIEEQELFNHLTQKYSLKRKELVVKEINYYFKLADIYNIVFLDAAGKSPEKSKNNWISINIDDGVNPDLINDESFKQLDVLRPHYIANRNPFDLKTHIEKTLYGRQKYFINMIKAYGMVGLYCKYVKDDLKRQNVESSPEIVKTVQNFVRTTIQIYKAILQTESLVLALTEYDKPLNKIFNQIGKNKEALLNELNRETNDLNEKLKQLEGIEREILKDEIAWKGKMTEEIKIEMASNKGRGHNVDEYNRIYADLRENQYDIRKVLFVIYTDVKQHVVANKDVDLDMMQNMLTTLDIVTSLVKKFVGPITENMEEI